MPATPFAPRPLGPGGPLVPPLGLGSWNTWDRMSEQDAVAIVQRAVAAGAGFFDVAYYNMGPHAENSRTDILFGNALRASGAPREQVFLCGKLWLWDWPRQGFRAQLEESLERAGLDRFDAVVVGDYLASPDLPALVGEVEELRRDGLFAQWGINNWRIDDTRGAIRVAGDTGAAAPAFAQLKYSIARRAMAEGEPYRRLFQAGVLGLQASDVFEGGILAGKLVPARKIGADVGGIRERIVAVYPGLERIAADFGATPAQLAVAFCLADPHVANVLFGASSLSQLEGNLVALELAARDGAALREALAGLQQDTEVAADGTW
ncbi:MAG: aldo/keto reductase [Microbacterium sp.]|uniref:aldo/keto reductase n=1 Tax=Microbacterium sp. TaxID=51671 RepID=UPI0039E24306